MNQILDNNLNANNYKARIKRINSTRQVFENDNKQQVTFNLDGQQRKSKNQEYNSNHAVQVTNQPTYNFTYGIPLNKNVYKE
jgi:hypothetical protein